MKFDNAEVSVIRSNRKTISIQVKPNEVIIRVPMKMKKKIFAVTVSAVLILSVALFAGCAENKPIEGNATLLNQAEASVPTVKNGELVSVNPDDAIDIALKHAGVSRENAVMFGTPSLDEDDGKPHYDIEFRYNGFEYDYEIAVGDGAVLKAEKEAEKGNVPVKIKPSKKAKHT